MGSFKKPAAAKRNNEALGAGAREEERFTTALERFDFGADGPSPVVGVPLQPRLTSALATALDDLCRFLRGKEATEFGYLSCQEQAYSEHWLAAAESLRADVIAGRYGAEVELLSDGQTGGIFGALRRRALAARRRSS